MNLPPYIDRASIHQRLQIIFPEGVPQHNYCVREAAASTVFTMLYIGAIEGTDIWKRKAGQEAESGTERKAGQVRYWGLNWRPRRRPSDLHPGEAF